MYGLSLYTWFSDFLWRMSYDLLPTDGICFGAKSQSERTGKFNKGIARWGFDSIRERAFIDGGGLR